MASESQLVELQQTLYKSANPTRRWLHCTRRDWIFSRLRRFAPVSGNARALEVGPGSGVYLPLMSELFTQVLATDVEDAFLKHSEVLRERHSNLSFLIDDITESKLAAHSFDLILCTEVVEHIADSAAAIYGMRRLLKPGGILILSTPQKYSPLELTSKIAFLPGIISIVRRIYNEPILETGHINLMTSYVVRQQLEKAGFSILETYKSGMYIPILAEFLGEAGLRVEKWLENFLRGKRGDSILWTQYYVCVVD